MIRDKEARLMERNRLKIDTCLLSIHESKSLKDELQNEDWNQAMKDEIDKIEKKKTWTLVPRPEKNNVIGTKWVYKNKLDENGEITGNKERLVCMGYAQE